MVAEVEVQPPAFPEALTWPQRAKALTVADAAGYAVAADMKLNLAALRKKIVEEFAPMKEAAHRAHKAITTKEAEYLKPITEAEGIVASAIKAFIAEQERLRRIEQARLEAEARKAAEEARLKQEAEAKVIRDEEIRLHAEAVERENTERLRLALAAEASGATADVVDAVLAVPVVDVPEVAPLEAYMEPAEIIVPVVVAPSYEPIKGLGISKRWGAEVFSVKLLAQAIANGDLPENYIEPNMTALNARARADKSLMKVPGVRAVER